MSTVVGKSIGDLQGDVLEMMGLANASIGESVRSLDDRDVDLANCIIQRDRRVDDLEAKIESECLGLLSGRLEGKALRIVAATYKIVSDIERIGDYCAAVAGVTLNVANKPVTSNLLDITKMSEITSNMLAACMVSYGGKSSLDVESVFRDDDKVDHLYNEVFVDSLTSILHEPGTITNILYTITAARALERIGDHITDIAERIHFIETGEAIRRKEPMHIPEFP
jgi:phosphate transport system protein